MAGITIPAARTIAAIDVPAGTQLPPPNNISWTTIVTGFGRFRDTHVLTQHAFASFNRFESVGKLLFEQPADWPFLML